MNIFSKVSYGLWILSFMILGISASAQHQAMQYYRPNDRNGINMFETSKDDTVSFYHLKVRSGVISSRAIRCCGIKIRRCR
jgi:hypothetical protein